MVKRHKNIFDDSYQIGKGKEMINQQKNCPFSYHQILRHFQKVAILGIYSILGVYSVVKSNKTPLPLPKHWEVVTRHFEQCYE